MRRQNPTMTIDYNQLIFNQALIMIEDLAIQMCGKNLNQLGLPAPERSADDCLNSEVLRESTYETAVLEQTINDGLPNLVQDQKIAYEGILAAINQEQGGFFFLDAPGGTGKTFLINLILARVRLDSKVILAVASSGIAATLLAGGRTAHSMLELPLDISSMESPLCGISRGTAKTRLLQQCKAIIWDECTMSHKKSLEALDRTLRDIRRNDSLFGGVVILAGDFRQTLPVIQRSTPADELNACLKRSPLWQDVKTFTLSTNMRVHLQGDIQAGSFAATLLTIGDGLYPQNPAGRIVLSSSLCNQISTRQELIDAICPDIERNISNQDWLRERAILGPTNEIVDEINDMVQDRLINDVSRTYYSIDQTVDPEQAVHYPSEFLNSLTPSGVPPHELKLKIGSPVMVLRNLCPPKLCNGTRLCVRRLDNNRVEATVLTGPGKGEVVWIPRIPFIPNDHIANFKRTQFPLKLAYGFTINKSQGQSLKMVGVELSKSCFSHGQLYVACSRVGSNSNLYIQAPGGETKNVVYRQALQ